MDFIRCLKIWMTSDFWRIALASLIARVISTIVNYVVNKNMFLKEKQTIDRQLFVF
ncbi:MAG: hypothetical protein ACLR43_13635 [Faecalibacillus faecis]